MMEFYEHKIIKAKKEHKCEFCKNPIIPGEQYSYECGKYDGDFFVRKLCLICSDILKDYFSDWAYGEDEFSWDEIEDFLSDKFCIKCVHGGSQEDDCDYMNYRCQIIESYYSERRKND